MAVKHRKTVYGIGSITTKNTHPGRDDRYLYAEWSVDGKHYYKSCGNAADPNSYKRARAVLREAAEERIRKLHSELELMRSALESEEDE